MTSFEFSRNNFSALFSYTLTNKFLIPIQITLFDETSKIVVIDLVLQDSLLENIGFTTSWIPFEIYNSTFTRNLYTSSDMSFFAIFEESFFGQHI